MAVTEWFPSAWSKFANLWLKKTRLGVKPATKNKISIFGKNFWEKFFLNQNEEKITKNFLWIKNEKKIILVFRVFFYFFEFFWIFLFLFLFYFFFFFFFYFFFFFFFYFFYFFFFFLSFSARSNFCVKFLIFFFYRQKIFYKKRKKT